MLMLGTWKKGETLSFRVGLVSGVKDEIISIHAAIKRHPLKSNDPVLANFSITDEQSVGEIPEGWMLTLDPIQTNELAPAQYVSDIKFVFENGQQYSETVTFHIINRVTP